MLAWLRDYAIEVQAFAALATVILTAALVYVTHRYVRLTATLAKAAAGESERQRQAAAGQRLQLLGLAGRLELDVRSLPDDRNDSKIRGAVLWLDDDVTQLTNLAAILGVSTAVDAQTAAISLRWLADRVRYVKSLPHSMDAGRRIPADEWVNHLKIARTSLARIEQREAGPLALEKLEDA